MIAIAAQQGDASLAGMLLQKLDDLHLRPEDLNTQDKAWLLAAAAALNGQNATADLTVNGKASRISHCRQLSAPEPGQPHRRLRYQQ